MTALTTAPQSLTALAPITPGGKDISLSPALPVRPSDAMVNPNVTASEVTLNTIQADLRLLDYRAFEISECIRQLNAEGGEDSAAKISDATLQLNCIISTTTQMRQEINAAPMAPNGCKKISQARAQTMMYVIGHVNHAAEQEKACLTAAITEAVARNEREKKPLIPSPIPKVITSAPAPAPQPTALARAITPAVTTTVLSGTTTTTVATTVVAADNQPVVHVTPAPSLLERAQHTISSTVEHATTTAGNLWSKVSEPTRAVLHAVRDFSPVSAISAATAWTADAIKTTGNFLADPIAPVKTVIVHTAVKVRDAAYETAVEPVFAAIYKVETAYDNAVDKGKQLAKNATESVTASLQEKKAWVMSLLPTSTDEKTPAIAKAATPPPATKMAEKPAAKPPEKPEEKGGMMRALQQAAAYVLPVGIAQTMAHHMETSSPTIFKISMLSSQISAAS